MSLRNSPQAVTRKASVGFPKDIQVEELRASGQTSLDPEVSFEMETKICMSVIWDCVGACHSKEIWTETKGVCTE